MTLIVRDEADIVDDHIRYHLEAGVDFVVATDHRSADATTEILQRYEREGHLKFIRELGEAYRQSEWVTRMARLAATEFGADWVINSDADEFWWPHAGDLKELLASIPDCFGSVQGFIRSFVPRPDDDSSFAERMIAMLTPLAPINDPSSPYRPLPKVIHRADPEVTVARGSHALIGSSLRPLRGSFPIETLHFPIRSAAQAARKAVLQWEAFAALGSRPGTAYHAKAYRAQELGIAERYYDGMAVADADLERGIAEGVLTVDSRLRDALRLLRSGTSPGPRLFALPHELERPFVLPEPDLEASIGLGLDAALLNEADAIRLARRVDQMEARLEALRGG